VGRNNSVGTAAELAAAYELEAEGFVVGSRRHIEGPGDILAVRAEWFATGWGDGKPVYEYEIRLIEVKASAYGPFNNFPPEDRAALIALAEELGAEPLLAWRKPKQTAIEWIGVNDWPGVEEMAA
jgi:hypothetical protein